MAEDRELLRILNNEIEWSDYYQRQEFILQTAQQIIKDFAEFGIDIEFSGDTEGAYRELFQQLEFHIRNILNRKQDTFFHMLYRIDVSDKNIKRTIALHPDQTLEAVLADVIIQRELKKVLLRYYFKTQSDQTQSF